MTQQEIVEQRVRDFTESFKDSRTLEYLSRFCLEHESTYTEGSTHKTSFNEGARSVILEIRHWLNYDLTKFGKEQDEQRTS